MTAGMQNLTVTKSVTVRAPRTRAFAVFTEKFFTWWPSTHHIGAVEPADAVIEPEVGGRWYERGVDGTECDWGRVLAFEPPARLVLSWHLRADWTYEPDPAKASEVEVRFVEDEPGTTRVELVHRHIERHDEPGGVASGVGSPNGWTGILALFAEAVA